MTSSWSFNLQGKLSLWSRGCTKPGRQVATMTKFCTVGPNICGFSVRNFLYTTLMAPRNVKWPMDFGKVVHPWYRALLFARKSPYKRRFNISVMTDKNCSLWCVKSLTHVIFQLSVTHNKLSVNVFLFILFGL